MTDYLTAAQVAELLGVTPRRVRALAKQRADFPKPKLPTPSHRVWSRAAVERWARTADRSPGRRAQ